jgi:ATP-dependent RNA helicase DeaD
LAFPPTCLPLARALEDRGYTDPTPVQSAVLAPEAEDRDLIVSAQTGSGKTIAYGLAIGATILGDANTLGPARDPVALIVAPTRELALQVHGELSLLYRFAGARIVYCVGGMDARKEQRQLSEGAHIVVGTPGRLRDHLERGALKVSALQAVVLDEADEMLDLGFREDLEFILETTPENRRTLLFSATLPKQIVALAKKYQRDAFRIQASGGGQGGHVDIEYRAMRVAYSDVEHAVVNVLRFVEPPSALVFCNTRQSVRHLQAILLERGFSVVALSGELSQSERNHALQALRDGRARVCVATDVAARGIDLPNLGLVIHADLPNDAEVLQHRSGRTGRAGRKGVSVLLIPPARRRKAEQILSSARITPVWGNVPSADDIRQLDHERLLENALFAEKPSDEDSAMAKLLLGARSAEDIAIAFSRLYRAQLPAPEVLADPGADRPRAEAGERRGKREPREKREFERPERGAFDGGSHERGAYDRSPQKKLWFHLDVGRSKNADPKWLVPMICRKGKITKADIGAIRIFDDETKFEINEDVAAQFAQEVRHAKSGDGTITPLGSSPGDTRNVAPREKTSEYTPREKPREYTPREKPRDFTPREKSAEYAPREKPRDYTPREKARDYTPRAKSAEYTPREKPRDFQRSDKPRDFAPKDRAHGAENRGGDAPPRKPWSEKPGGKPPFKGKPAFEGKGGDRPHFNDRPPRDAKPRSEDRPRDDSRSEKPRHGDKPFGDKKFGDKKFAGEKKFGSKPFGDKKFGGKKFGDKPAGGAKFSGKNKGKPGAHKGKRD